MRFDTLLTALAAALVAGWCFAGCAESEGAEQGVADRVQQHVGIGVAEQAEMPRDMHPADDQGPLGNQAVDIETVADAHQASSTRPAASSARARARSAGVVSLILNGLPGTTATGQPHHSTKAASSVPA